MKCQYHRTIGRFRLLGGQEGKFAALVTLDLALQGRTGGGVP
jgi:hypothetical protein